MQYSPQTQPIREQAIDRLVEQALLIGDSGMGLTPDQICEHNARAGFRFQRSETFRSIERLTTKARVQALAIIKPQPYSLTETAANELWELQRSSELRIEQILRRLYSSVPSGWRSMEKPFLRCVSTIFSELGEMYALQLRGDISKNHLLVRPRVGSAIDEALITHPGTDASSFRAGIARFFSEEDPDFGALKWNMTQNYYVSKALGFDPTGSLLSKEILDGSDFYLDTNILISALTPLENNHANFLAVSRVCADLGVGLKFCQISIDELRHVVSVQAEMIRNIEGRIPAESAAKISNIFYAVYKEKPLADRETAFEEFYNPTSVLTQYSAERVDSEWFVEQIPSIDDDPLFGRVRGACTYREKSDHVARHDALLIKWVERERQSSGRKIWLLTRDTTLPKVETSFGSLAVTLDALLQWIAPIAMQESVSDSFAEIFADAIKFQLLPQDNFLDLRDFQLLLDLGVSCRDLPAADVEECIRHLKAIAPVLDPTDPRQRERLQYQMAKFFSDPGRRYKEETAKLEEAKDREIEQWKSALDNSQQKVQNKDSIITDLEERLRQVEIAEAAGLLRKSALLRFWSTASIGVLLVFLVVTLAHKQITGNWFQQITSAWPMLLGACAVTAGLGRVIIGPERLRVLLRICRGPIQR